MKTISQRHQKIVGLKELRENIEKYISGVNKGSSFIVVRRSKPIFKISPVVDEPELWESVIDFTQINKKGVPIWEILSRI